MSNDFIEAHMRRLSPEARGLVEAVDRILDNGPGGVPPEELYGDLIPSMGALSERDRDILAEVFAAKASAHHAQADQALREKAVIERLGDLVRRAQQLSGRELLTVREAVGWLRDEGRLSEEEERLAASVMDLTVEVPDPRG